MGKFIITCILSFLLTATLLEGQNSYTLKGRIVDSDSNKPVADAVIFLSDPQTHVYSDSLGWFEIPGLSAGKYSLHIVRLGYRDSSLQTEIKGGEQLDLLIELRQQPLQSDEILVTSVPYEILPQYEISEKSLRDSRPKDIGEYLKNYPNLAAVRKGGYANDPVLRGFKYDRLNIQYDGGIRVSNACPNRMDPITTHVQAEDLQKIEIIKGPYSVRFGQAMGGVINLVMKRPNRTETFRVNASLEGGYESNGSASRERLGLTAGNSFYNLYFSAANKDYGNYSNGSGMVVPSSFRVNDYSMKLSITPAENHYLQTSWRQSFARDVFHAGLPMDTQEDNTSIWSMDYNGKNLSSKLFSLTAKLYLTGLHHVMDNSRRPNSKMVMAISDLTSRTMGGKLELGTHLLKNGLWYFGADLYRVEKDGSRQRLVSMNPCNMMAFDPPKEFIDPVWQNSDLTNAGLFTELRKILNSKVAILTGARVDWVTSRIGEAAPQFIALYGLVGDKNGVSTSASATVNYEFRPNTTLQLAVGRGSRMANITERYINHLTIGQDPYEYVGNPNLKPEVNNQIELSLEQHKESFNIKGSIFYSYITNYITAVVNPEIDRLFMPCAEPKHAKQFINVNQAAQTGFELTGGTDFLRHIRGWGSVAYTRGQNLEWDEPLPEIPPLEAKLAFRYTYPGGLFWIEADGRFAARQKRISKSFGETETPGFTVYNLLASIKPWHFLELHAGVRNIFNKTYYEHLNRRYRNQPLNSVVWEPGRTVVFLFRLSY